MAEKQDWDDLHAIILVVSDKKKGTPSTAGMQKTVATSALLQHRIKHVVPQRMERISKAIKEKNFEVFAKETMEDSNQFHAVCLDTSPPIFYLSDVSRSIIQLVEELNRASGTPIAAYTYDAGPNAVLYVQRANVPLVLSTVLKYFPQTEESFPDPFQTGVEAGSVKLPEGFRENVILETEVGVVPRIIHTCVGDGPRVLSDEKEGLLGQDGMPKSLKA